MLELSVSVVPDSKLPAGARCPLGALGALTLRRRFPFGGPLAATAMLRGRVLLRRRRDARARRARAGGDPGRLADGYGNPRRRAILGLFLQYVCIQIIDGALRPAGRRRRRLHLAADRRTVARRCRRYETRAEVGRNLEQRTLELERAREDVAQSAVAEERLRIARELHDVVAHSISVMTIQAGAARLLLDESPERAEEPLLRGRGDRPRDALGDAPAARRPAPRHGASGQLEARPSLEHVDSLVEHYRESGLPVDLVVEGTERTLPPGLDLAAYRVVQEALTNALKHAAGAARRGRDRATAADSLDALVSNTGAVPARGRARSATGGGGGHGLVGMRERAEIYGDGSRPARRAVGGFRVSARVPARASRPVTRIGGAACAVTGAMPSS